MTSRPQVGIDRLPTKRMSTERESMNCKSCRKRKIKCNRSKPTCEACKIFQCACVYDAVPKKRGPKTDVLESLLKRVDGLEKRLQDEKKNVSPTEDTSIKQSENVSEKARLDTTQSIGASTIEPSLFSPVAKSDPSPIVLPDALLEIFFARVHGKPYYILDEFTIRQRHQLRKLHPSLLMAVYAVSARHVTNSGDYNAAFRVSQDYSMKAREAVDVDEPSIEGLQTLLLLSMAFFAAGKGKKSYMMLSNAVGMAFALDLHRERPRKMKISSTEREMRRRLFWSCYMMDHFTVCGSKRPSLISDKSIILRLPSFMLHPTAAPIEGELFNAGPNMQYFQDSRRKTQGASGLLIDVARILGITNRYLAAGGVKGDSHFPWHSLSNLSKIRQELDIWVAGTQDTFASIETLFGQPDSTTLLLSKLIYHLVHCLIYRPFLPINLAELRGTGQHQSWQIEATNLCFLHANAMAELVELGKSSANIEWPAFVGYCICTAGTVFVHGVHYKGHEGEVFSSSADFLARTMHQLSWLRMVWAGVQHQRDTLQKIYSAHTELVLSLASNPMRFSPVFHLEDFFDRYPDQDFDGSHVTFEEVVVEAMHESLAAHDRDRSSNSSRQAGSNISQPSTTLSQSQHFPPTFEAISSPLPQPPQTIPNQADRPKAMRRSTVHIVIPSSSSAAPSFQQYQHPPEPQHTQVAALGSPATPKMTTAFSPLPDFSTLSNLPEVSPSPFSFSPSAFPVASDPAFAPSPPPNFQYANFPFDQFRQQNNNPYQNPPQLNTALTPGAQSQNSGSHATDGSNTSPAEKDPFLSLLEQLAENEQLDLLSGGMGDFGPGQETDLGQRIVQ